jgi:hypothetical protein
MDYDTPSSGDIFFQKGLRFKSEESLKIQKPYTSYQSDVNNEITIPYGTNLTNLESRLTTLESGSGGGSSDNNKATFRQSLIDHTTMNNPNGNLFQTITSGQKYFTTMKTLVGDDIFPKTTNTLLTVYYTSYIKNNLPQVTNNQYKNLIQYYCTNETNAAIKIAVINSTYYTSPRFRITIFNSINAFYKDYIITPDESKIVIDLTADLAIAKPNKEIVYAQFVNEFEVDSNTYYYHCINILSNIFISYTYDE